MLLLGLVRARAVSINVAAARARASASASVRGCLSAAPPRPAPLLGALGARAAAFSTESSAVVAAVPFYIKHPLMVAIAVATVKTAAADLLIQKQVEHRKEVDWRRLGLFTAFGACYFGAFQYFLYVRCFSHWFDAARLSKMSLRAIFTEGGAARSNWLKQMGFDLLVHGHFFFPVYYTFKISITDQPSIFDGRPITDIVAAALAKYWVNGWDDWVGFWKVWIPGDIIVFGLVPMWARLPVNNAISFLYVLVLSSMRGAPEDEEKAEEGGEAVEDEKKTAAAE